jgi:hypothetical protein
MTRLFRFSVSGITLNLVAAACLFLHPARNLAARPQGNAAPDALMSSPDHYKLEFENQFVRVIRVHYGGHDTSPMHVHPAPGGVLVPLLDQHARLHGKDGSAQEVHFTIGQARWADSRPGSDLSWQTTHWEENLSEQPFELIRVEVKPQPATQSAKVAAVANSMDPLVVDPQHYHLVLENEFVKVIRCRIPPHDHVVMHRHTTDSVIIFMTDQNLKQTAPDGTVTQAHNQAGRAIWTHPTTHMGENISDQPYEYIRVDIKSAL